MSCNNNTCHEPTCNECNPVNPCYENCGCLNPTTFECITNFTQNYPYIPLNVNQTGSEFLSQLNATINGLQSNLYKVKADDSDTCPDNLFDKIEAGSNIGISVSGSGCNRKLTINAGTGFVVPPDVFTKVSANDTTSGYLGAKTIDGIYVKKTITSPGANEKIKFDITIADLISGDSGNQLTQGLDGKLKTSFSAPNGSETKISIADNSGLTKSGTGTSSDPYILGTYGNNFPARTYFNGVWRDIIFNNGAAANLSVTSQSVKFRYRTDGSIEFKGSVTYSVKFDAGTGNKRIINGASFPANGINNVTSGELDRIVNLKNYMTFDVPTAIATAPNLTGYNINMLDAAFEFMHNTTAAAKIIVITMDGCVYHPSL